MPDEILPIDLMLRLSPQIGWAVDRPRLSETEIEELAALVDPPLSDEGREQFGIFVQNIFAFAVEGLLTQSKYGNSPVVEMRDRLEIFLKEMERAQAAIDGLDAGVRRLLDGELAKFAQAQNAPRHLPKTSIEQWRLATSDLIGVIVAANRRLEVTPVKGESGAVWRQMVRGLVALVHATTGIVPKRAVELKLVGYSATQIDDGRFLQLARRLAALVFAHAEQLRKTLPPPLKATTRQKTKKKAHKGQRSAASAGKLSREKNSRSARVMAESKEAEPSTKKKKPKRVGPPALTRIVREELQALEKEIVE